MKKTKQIPEWIMNNEIKSDSVYFDCVPKIVSLFDECQKIEKEYLGSKRGYFYSNGWYKKAITKHRKLVQVTEAYVDHGFRHHHDPLMFEKKYDINAGVLTKETTFKYIDLDRAYKFSLMRLILWHADTFNELERAIYLKKFNAYEKRVFAYWEKEDARKAAKAKSKKVTKKSIKK